MIDTKNSALTCENQGAFIRLFAGTSMTTDNYLISLYPRGIKTTNTYYYRKRENVGGQRGIIKCWSSASRKRFRSFLQEHVPNGDVYGVTLTIPGSIVSPDELRATLNRLKVACHRANVGIVWRLELQRRGQPHLHIIAVHARNKQGSKRARSVVCAYAVVWWRWLWLHLLSQMSMTEGKFYINNKLHEGMCSRNLIVGASEHSCDVQVDNGGVIWWRYLLDHASKTKQHQLMDWEGFRHWGIINRKLFLPATPLTYSLEHRHFKQVYRILRRLHSRRIRAKCVFGNKRVASPRRNSQGSADWFGVSPLIMQKILEHVTGRKIDISAHPKPLK